MAHRTAASERRRVWVFAGLIVGCAFATAGTAGAQPCADIARQHRQSVVRLHAQATLKATGAVKEAFGTGVIVSPQGHVLTNNHVVSLGSDTDQLMIAGAIGTKVAPSGPLQLLAQNEYQDLALLVFENTAAQYQSAPLGRPLAVLDGSPLCSAGFPLDLEFFVTSGILGGKGGPRGWWVTQMPSNPGESGAPVFDAAGKVVAVKVGGRTDAQNINLVIPINMAAPLLLVTGMSPKLTMALTEPGSDIAPSLEERRIGTCPVDQGRESTGGLAPSSGTYTAVCRADPGFHIVKAELVRDSENNLSDVNLVVSDDGGTATLSYRLTSGPLYDRWRGWLNGRIVLQQIRKDLPKR